MKNKKTKMGGARKKKIENKDKKGLEVPKKSLNLVKKRLQRIIEDENTTNSEASEKSVYCDINWEENLEVDTSCFLDEFAPPMKATRGREEEKKQEAEEQPAVAERHSPSPSPSPPPSPTPQPAQQDIDNYRKYFINYKLLVQNYNTNEWQKAVIAELDWEDNEILVHYEDNSGIPDEWLSMSSQRIKDSTEPSVPSYRQVEMKLEKEEKPLLTETIVGKPEIRESTPPVKLLSPKLPRKRKSHWKQALMTSSKKMKKISQVQKSTLKKISYKKLVVNKVKRGVLKKKINRRLPIWKTSQKGEVNGQRVAKSFKGKFTDGEKVLAKWSDHRMQKFPAVIKKVSGPGQYDVLFYDGFEKTILEENIYKTTEEEIAKYNHSKPSEADTFIDMDIASKAERRQKKRKIFDDFLSDQFFRRKRRHFELGEVKRDKSSEGRAKDSDPSSSSVQNISVHRKKMRRNLGGEAGPSSPQTPSRLPAQPSPPPQPSTTVKIEPEDIKTEDDLPDIKQEDEDCLSSLENYPLKITCHDGVVRKSVLIRDATLPPGWTKHVIAWLKDSRACFLFTPDGYAVHTMGELRKYYKLAHSSEPPDTLNFFYPQEDLDKITAAQVNWPTKGLYRKWINKVLDERKVGKKVRILPPSRSHFPLKRIRTLLPKYRTSLSSNLPGSAKSSVEEKVWRCPKEGCNKKFRKENLLQMHIKHYHSEFKALVGAAPNVVDLALARSAESSWSPDTSKHSLKRIFPKLKNTTFFSESPPKEQSIDKDVDDKVSFSPARSKSPKEMLESDEGLGKKIPGPVEEKKTTIKTLMPNRSSRGPAANLLSEVDSECSKADSEHSYDVKTTSTHKLQRKHIDKPCDDTPKDHSTGQIPRAHKRKQMYAFEKLHITTDSNDSYAEEEKISPNIEMTEDGVLIERLKSEEVINCTCGYKEEDGLMIQCEICLCWQHGICHGIERDKDVPENYVCKICLNPCRVRSSQKYTYSRHYFTQAKLPKFSYRTCKVDLLKQREEVLARSFNLTASLQHLQRIERSLAAKISIAQQADHPKLYLWSTNWDNREKSDGAEKSDVKKETSEALSQPDGKRSAPVPEAPIESEDCRLRLLEHIDHCQQQMESRLNFLQTQVAGLECEDGDLSNEGSYSDQHPLLKQAVYMLLRDLVTLRTATALS